MSATHLHLILCHFPVVGQFIALAGVAAGFLRKDRSLRRWSLGLMVLVALSALPVTWSGEKAEDRVESLQGISMDAMEVHEEAAETALVLVLVSGGAAALSLVVSRWSLRSARLFAVLAYLLAIASTISLAYTANLGGRIRHTEIENSSTL